MLIEKKRRAPVYISFLVFGDGRTSGVRALAIDKNNINLFIL
jgi:hypothetical protein